MTALYQTPAPDVAQTTVAPDPQSRQPATTQGSDLQATAIPREEYPNHYQGEDPIKFRTEAALAPTHAVDPHLPPVAAVCIEGDLVRVSLGEGELTSEQRQYLKHALVNETPQKQFEALALVGKLDETVSIVGPQLAERLPLKEINLIAADLSRIEIKNVQFENCDLRHATLTAAQLKEITIHSSTQIDGLVIKDSDPGLKLEDLAFLKSRDVRGANLSGIEPLTRSLENLARLEGNDPQVEEARRAQIKEIKANLVGMQFDKETQFSEDPELNEKIFKLLTNQSVSKQIAVDTPPYRRPSTYEDALEQITESAALITAQKDGDSPLKILTQENKTLECAITKGPPPVLTLSDGATTFEVSSPSNAIPAIMQWVRKGTFPEPTEAPQAAPKSAFIIEAEESQTQPGPKQILPPVPPSSPPGGTVLAPNPSQS